MKRFRGIVFLAVAIGMFFLLDCRISAQDVNLTYIDAADLIYQAGGWGTPSAEYSISQYTVSPGNMLKEAILSALQEKNAYLDVIEYGLTVDDTGELAVIFAEVINENPDLFYVQSRLAYSGYGENGIAALYFFYLDVSDEDRLAYSTRVNEIIALLDTGMSDEEKALFLHDYLAQHCAYAYREYLDGTLDPQMHVYDAFGALVKGKAVCQGYAEAYNALLRKAEISSSMCTSDSMKHAWNVVMIDGDWYHVDVTWDDPTWNAEGRSKHNYFLLSDSEIGNRGHSDWNDNVECTSTKYDSEDYWWCDINSQIVMGEARYYISSTADGFQLIEEKDAVHTVKYTSTCRWEVWDNPLNAWRGQFSYLSAQGDYLYFNDKLNLYSLSPGDSTPHVLYTYTGNDGYIYGAMVYEDGKARLNIETTPNKTDDEYQEISLQAPTPTITVDYEEEKISTTYNMEYSMDNGASWNPCSDEMALSEFGWNGTQKIELLVRNKASGGLWAGEPMTVTLDFRPYSVHGKVSAFGSTDTITRISLINMEEMVMKEESVYIGENYEIRDITPGEYTLKAECSNHVSRLYSISVSEDGVELDIELQLRGDVDGDGRITSRDNLMIYNHIANKNKLSGYEILVGDVDGDGRITSRDNLMIYNHIAQKILLWV